MLHIISQADCNLACLLWSHVLQVGHGEFVTEWPSSFTQAEADASTPNTSSSNSNSSTSSSSASSSYQQQSPWVQQLPSYCRDLAVVVIGQPPVNFVHKSRVAGSSSSSTASSTASSSAAADGSSTDLKDAGSIGAGQVLRNVGGVVAGVSSSVPDVLLEWN
jgi:hypothetical protein